MRKTKISDILQPLSVNPEQAYIGKYIHTLGLIKWVIEQIGDAEVLMSSYSTSEEFLRGFYLLKKKMKISHSAILTDVKASKKTAQLNKLMMSCFDKVYLAENHSKLVLFRNDKYHVSIITSMNQTYGSRAESTIITTNTSVYNTLFDGFNLLTEKSMKYGIPKGNNSDRAGISGEPDTNIGDFRPFGIEW